MWKAGVTITDNVRRNLTDFVIIFNVFYGRRIIIERVFPLQAFLYSLWYFTFSILGNFNNFFFAAHLLDVAVGFKTLRTILQSVTHNGKQVNHAGNPHTSLLESTCRVALLGNRSGGWRQLTNEPSDVNNISFRGEL